MKHYNCQQIKKYLILPLDYSEKKWKNEEKFLQYFSSQWLNSKNGWFEGLATYVPSTNNALEATNRVIKDEDTLRERLVL